VMIKVWTGAAEAKNSLSITDCRIISLMHPLSSPDIDWTGVKSDESPVAPLDANTFVLRLRLLGERANDLTILRAAFVEQNTRGEQLSRPSESALRPSD